MDNLTCPDLGDITSDYGSRDNSGTDELYIEGFSSGFFSARKGGVT